MFDSDEYTPAEGQIFTWSTADQAMIPTNIQNGSVYQNNSESTGTGSFIVASLPIDTTSVKVITGQVTLFVNSSNGYLPLDSATWAVNGVITVYKGGLSYEIAPEEYDNSSPTVTPTAEFAGGTANFNTAYLGIECVNNQLFIIITPDSTYAAEDDNYKAYCSLLIDDITVTV